MAKRFTETGIWQDEWFMELQPDYKLAYMFIKDNCDPAGIWKPNKRLAEIMIGMKIEWEKFLVEAGKRILVLKNDYWWITKFCEFQYGTLSEKCIPHKKVIEILVKNDLSHRVHIEYINPLQGVKEKKREYKEEDKEEENKRKEEEVIEIEVSPTFEDFWNEYDKKVGDKEKILSKWKKLKQIEREAIMEFIPNYKISEPDKQYRKHPETFLNNKSWNDELIFKSNGKPNTKADHKQSEWAQHFASKPEFNSQRPTG